MSRINFTGTFINTIPVIKRSDNGKQKVDVSFVELDVNNNKDMDALENIANNWGDESYADMVYEDMTEGYWGYSNDIIEHTYVLTTQHENFDEMNPDEILGVTLFKETREKSKLELLQTNPKYIKKDNPNSEYNGIGSAIIDSLKSLHGKKPIECFAVKDAIDFYEKNGFVHNDLYEQPNRHIWYG